MKKDFLIYFNSITNIFLLLILFFGGLIWADTNGIWTDAKDIRGGIFGSDEQPVTSNYTFINPVYFNTFLKSSNSSYFINISGRTQLNDVATEKISTNNLTLSNDKNCLRVGTDSSGNINCLNSTDSFPTCTSSQSLSFNGTDLICVTNSGGSGSGSSGLAFYGTNHTKTQCTNASGTVTDYINNSFCKFSQSSCPTGWTQYKSLTTTSSSTCNPSPEKLFDGTLCATFPCTTSNHNFANLITETCIIKRERGGSNPHWSCNSNPPYSVGICTASIIEIGCY